MKSVFSEKDLHAYFFLSRYVKIKNIINKGKKWCQKKKQPTKSEKLAKQIINEYKPETVEDMQEALKDVFGPMFEAMLKGEMTSHLGYESNNHS